MCDERIRIFVRNLFAAYRMPHVAHISNCVSRVIYPAGSISNHSNNNCLRCSSNLNGNSQANSENNHNSNLFIYKYQIIALPWGDETCKHGSQRVTRHYTQLHTCGNLYYTMPQLQQNGECARKVEAIKSPKRIETIIIIQLIIILCSIFVAHCLTTTSTMVLHMFKSVNVNVSAKLPASGASLLNQFLAVL